MYNNKRVMETGNEKRTSLHEISAESSFLWSELRAIRKAVVGFLVCEKEN